MVIADYNKIRAGLFNSQALLDSTGLTLFSINETSLSLWYKNKTRREEIITLLQGHSVPGNISVATDALPPLRECPPDLQGQPEVMVFPEPEDRSGRLQVRKRSGKQQVGKSVSSNVISVPSVILSHPTQAITQPLSHSCPPVSQSLQSTATLSRTTLWRRRKQVASSGGNMYSSGVESTKRKIYTCKVCEQPMTSDGHTQFKGKRYCPHEVGAPPAEEWLAQRRAEAAARAAYKDQQ